MKEPIVTNLQILAPSRKAPKAGDIFVFHPKGRGYFFGRVVRTDAKMRYMADSNLVYLFATESETKQPVDLLAVDEQILLQRALQWLAKREITVKVPANFPTAEKVSLSEPIVVPKD